MFALTDALLATPLPDTAYFGGSASVQSSNKPLTLGGNIECRQERQAARCPDSRPSHTADGGPQDGAQSAAARTRRAVLTA